MKKDLKKIINHYGVMPQLKHLNSEVFELTEAIIKYEDCRSDRCKILEELADVYVLLNQFQIHYDIDTGSIESVMRNKINRQLERIKEEYKPFDDKGGHK